MEGKGQESVAGSRPSTAYEAPTSVAAASSSKPSASASANANESSWWRWSHGKSGSISSSSNGTAGASHNHPHSTSTASHMGASNDVNFISMPAWDTTPRWQKRTTRTGLQSRDENAGATSGSPSLSSSSSPKFAIATSSALGSSTSGSAPVVRGTASLVGKKKMVQTSIRSARDVTTKKRFAASATNALQDFSLAASGKEARAVSATSVSFHDHGAPMEIKWTLGPGKRKVVKKDKKIGRSTSSSLQHPRGPTSIGGQQRTRRAWLDDSHYTSDDETTSGDLYVDVDMLEEKPTRCFSPTSTASTISSSASDLSAGPSAGSSASSASLLAHTGFVKSCAMAIIQDCHREQYSGQYTRKRKLEGRAAKADAGAESMMWSSYGCLSKSPGGCGSSSSDEELGHASSMDGLRYSDKSDRDSDSNLTQNELCRQMMLSQHRVGSSSSSVSSSPDLLHLSPSNEQQGLPLLILHQLPIAKGTANETDKECPICQIRYGIGDHILTLPCQHFFHACCVDKWLTYHTSCPLCRTNVLDADVEEFGLKHPFTKCSQSDQEAIRRKFRSSHNTGFRPVVPEIDQLQSHLAGMDIGDESSEANHVKYLVCPTPQRLQRK